MNFTHISIAVVFTLEVCINVKGLKNKYVEKMMPRVYLKESQLIARLVYEMAVYEKKTPRITLFNCPKQQRLQEVRTLTERILVHSSTCQPVTLKVVPIDFFNGSISANSSKVLSSWVKRALNKSAMNQMAVVDMSCGTASEHLLQEVVIIDVFCSFNFDFLLLRLRISRFLEVCIDGYFWKILH